MARQPGRGCRFQFRRAVTAPTPILCEGGCGRLLRTPDSIRRRYGPVCWEKANPTRGRGHSRIRARRPKPVTPATGQLTLFTITTESEHTTMGLDIRAYSNLTYIGHHEKWTDEDAHYEKHHEAYAYDSFAHALAGVPDLKPMDGVSASFLTGGCYQATDKTESHGFRAGSYSGYNWWRADLATQFNPYRGGGAPDPDLPFYELIWFADNEGTIGEIAAAELLRDFREHEVAYRTAQEKTEHGSYAVDRYLDWMRAFELASQSGLVDFH